MARDCESDRSIRVQPVKHVRKWRVDGILVDLFPEVRPALPHVDGVVVKE